CFCLCCVFFFRIRLSCFLFFFFNVSSPLPISSLSLHDALPISDIAMVLDECLSHPSDEGAARRSMERTLRWACRARDRHAHRSVDRKSTRLNSSHGSISYAVFCLKKKKERTINGKTQRNISHT